MPLEGPGSLEALGRGTAFIQPKIQPPEAEKLFKGKPTSRVVCQSLGVYLIQAIFDLSTFLCFKIDINLHYRCSKIFLQLTSQVPYLETFFGPPYVYTIDTSNEELVDAVLKNISKMQVSITLAKSAGLINCVCQQPPSTREISAPKDLRL